MSATNPFVELFGETLEDQAGKPIQTNECLQNMEAVGIYFSAHWCPPCRGFTPVLGKKYQELKAAGKKVEIVFASSDSDAAAFSEYASSQPWIRLPYADRAKKEALSSKYGVRGIPTLVFLDGQTGKLITDGGRAAVSSDNFIENFPYHPKPMYDLGESVDGINSSPSLVVMMERANAATQQEISALLERLAIKELAEATPRVTKFFTGTGSGPVAQIRKGSGLPAFPPAQHKHELKNIGAEGEGRWGCDGCGSRGTAPRWTCPEGCDFDYCQSCVDAVGTEVDAKITEPSMAILNLSDQGAVYKPAVGGEQVTEANIEAFIAAFASGTGVEKSQWVR